MSTNDRGSQWRTHETAERPGLTPPSKLVLNTQQLARALNEAPLDLSGLHHWAGGKINQERITPGTGHVFEFVTATEPVIPSCEETEAALKGLLSDLAAAEGQDESASVKPGVKEKTPSK